MGELASQACPGLRRPKRASGFADICRAKGTLSDAGSAIQRIRCRFEPALVDLPNPKADTTTAMLLEGLMPFFEQGTFRPPPIDRVIALSDGRAAYQEVDREEVRGRIVLAP